MVQNKLPLPPIQDRPQINQPDYSKIFCSRLSGGQSSGICRQEHHRSKNKSISSNPFSSEALAANLPVAQ